MKKTSLVVALCVFLVASAVGGEATESKSEAVTFLPESKSLNAQMIQSTGPLLQPLGTHPVLGRDFIKKDFEKQSPPVAIISSALWVTAAGSRPDIIGQKIRAGDQEFVVISVAPKSPASLEGMKVWLAGTR
jgi:hypothetical protein